MGFKSTTIQVEVRGKEARRLQAEAKQCSVLDATLRDSRSVTFQIIPLTNNWQELVEGLKGFQDCYCTLPALGG